jgi:ABC-type transport system involved in cytochrome c biogenesis ATPase subunit
VHHVKQGGAIVMTTHHDMTVNQNIKNIVLSDVP